MTIASDYYARTGESVIEACKRLHTEGIKVDRASQLIGFCSSSDLRKWLSKRDLPCPWPKKPHPNRGRPPIKITDAMMEQYAALRHSGVPAPEAAKAVGKSPTHIRHAIYARRPDIKLPIGKQAGEPWSRSRSSSRRVSADARNDRRANRCDREANGLTSQRATT